jgi:rhodanese-related sulfurtransferase
MRLHRVASFLLAGVVLGLLWNAWSGRGIDLGRNVFLQQGDEYLDAEQARQRLEQGALFLDARPEAFWEMSHIPGALPLPEDDFDRYFEKLEPRLRGSFLLVVYCSGMGCESSHIVAEKLKNAGIHAAIFYDGLPAWEDAGYPLERGTG